MHTPLHCTTPPHPRRKLCQVFTVEDVEHMMVPRDKVVECYVHETDGVVSDFCSFYHLPSTVFKCDKHTHLSAVYSYYNVATTMPFADLMMDALVLAKIGGVDVFNALDLMENRPAFGALQFGAGDGNLQYYVYNWNCPEIDPHEVGLVLV
jgi:glycylpeptide N-tetradecanoyltransferase